MELRQLIYFIEVAKREHVTKAAEEMHIAQSAVSRQISLLEAELGVTLFYREGRNVQLTPIGKTFLEHAELVLLELDKAKKKVEEYLNPNAGVLKLGFSTGLSVQTFSMVFSQFKEMHPNLQFQLLQGTQGYLLKLMERGEVDIAFAAPVPQDEPLVKGDILFTEKILLLMPEHHPLAQQHSIRVGQLRSERFVTFRAGLPIRQFLDKACEQAGFEPAIAFEGEDMDTIKGLVSAGIGIAILPELALASHLPGGVVTAEISDAKFARSVGLITPNTRKLAPSEQLLYQFLKAFYDRLYRFQL
ncbi:LysR family transcriptional regulator [Heyndrickxia acidicola]|uniref:LysR family transcriptional regulator n=1 Tax=Heyndrickxia acidicola TaxID=209389 RepID=A0ABU6MJW1_9BACI|nr:LysR family transcriptional regulator [Heyndrickxia acidicola]MED1204972.1 LysR family transcriptional regulator [Heyndrickxia acidicola]